MPWNVETTKEFREWLTALSGSTLKDVVAVIEVLKARGPNLGFPYSSKIIGSRHSNMRELRIQHAGRPYRALYAFDPRRAAILLLGGDKTGDDRWYGKHVPIADRLYDEHLLKLKTEEDSDGAV